MAERRSGLITLGRGKVEVKEWNFDLDPSGPFGHYVPEQLLFRLGLRLRDLKSVLTDSFDSTRSCYFFVQNTFPARFSCRFLFGCNLVPGFIA